MISPIVSVVSTELNSSPSLVDMLQFPRVLLVKIILVDEFGWILTLDTLRNSFLGCVTIQTSMENPS